MKIILISAFLCLAGLSQAGNVQRFARNTEAIIPTIVEEILKVELQSDLKKNSVVEVIEEGPVVKTIKEEVIIDPVASRIIEEIVAIEEKKPEIVENVEAVKEVVPEVAPATRTVEPAAEIIEKVEIVAVQENVDKPVDNFRTESVPSVEQIAEVVKEIVPVETVSDLRQEPAAVVMIKEEEIVQPMFRNVVKEEIPQVEALRNVPVESVDAVKDIVPEPVAAANVAPEPVIAVEPQVKTVVVEVIKEEVKADVPEVKAVPVVPAAPIVQVPVEVIKDEPIKEEVAVVPEVKAVPEVIAPAAPVPAPVEAVPAVEESDPQTRQDRPSIVQQIQQNLAGLPVVGQIFNRNPSVADDAPASDATTGSSVAEEKPPAPTNPLGQIGDFVQTAFQNTQQNLGNFLTNVQNVIQPTQNSGENRPPGPVQALINFINPTTGAPQKDEEKPEKADEKPEAPKSVEPEPAVAVDPVVVQKEVVEPQKIVEENENIVKV